jgi:hypothetical protein
MFRTRPAVVAVVSLLAAAGAASADTVEARFVGSGLHRTVQVSGVANVTVHAGELIHEFRNGTGAAAGLTGQIRTFCTEVTQLVNSNWRVFDLVAPSNAPNPGPPMGDQKALMLARLYDLAAGQQNTSADYAAAFQMMIWEIVYDFDAANAATGNLSRTDGNIRFLSGDSHFGTVTTIFESLRTQLLAYNGVGVTNLAAIVNSGSQDQLLLIPLPTAGAMGLAGLGLVAARRRRR